MEQQEFNVVYQYVVPVKFHTGDKNYSFGTDDDSFQVGEEVVVETVRGLEMGTISGETKETPSELADVLKPIIRRATPEDIENNRKNKEDEPSAMEKCRKAIEELNLPMALIRAEYTLDRSKIAFTYVSEERVDFRELLKNLAAIFHTRIELRQVGPRDKAKLVGGLGICGMTVCCNRFQKDFGVISINMAKNQLLALNPQKLSGQCGKLMCCLAYENEDYKILREGLPKMNSAIIYNDKKYRITSMNVLDNSARLSNINEVVDISLDELKALVEYNNKHQITAQKFVKEQREKELLEKNNTLDVIEEKAETKDNNKPNNRDNNQRRNNHNHRNNRPKKGNDNQKS